VKIGGRLLVLSLLSAPLSHAQAPASKAAPAAAPPSSATFGPDAEAPTTAAPAPPPAPPATVPDAGPEPEPAPPASSNGARPARVMMAPSSEAPEARDEEPTPVDEAEEPKAPHGHLHDGFYLRLALGVGYISAATKNDSSLTGWGVAPDIWMGGSPIPGLAIGVTFNGVSSASPHADIAAADSGGVGHVSGDIHGSLTYSVFGLVADIYPMPRAGLHFMAGVNYSVLKLDPDNGVEVDAASGVGLVGGVGYEWWIARDWSVGPLARLHWASVSDDVDTFTLLSPVILLGFTYH
jgi:hypothetical protein